MNKYELAKLFGDVDDKFIEGAKPEAQQAVHLTIKKRSPLKIAIASTCAAAVLAGGVITVNALRSSGGVSPLSKPDPVSIIDESSGISDNASDPNSSVSQEKTGNWFSETQIYYEGEYYMVPELARSLYYLMDEGSAPKVLVLAGIRQTSENTVDIVTVLMNRHYEPAGIRSYGPDSVAEVYFTPKEDDPYKTQSNNDWMTDRPLSVILQPGEACYQKNSFKVGLGEYVANIDYVYENAYPEQSGFGGCPGTKFEVDITENGIQDSFKPEDLTMENHYESPELNGKLLSDVVKQLENEGMKYSIVNRLDDTVPKDCVIKAFLPINPTGDHHYDAILFVSLGSNNISSTVSESDETYNKPLSKEEWAAKPLVLPSKSAPEDFDFVNTGDGFQSPNTTIEADRGSEVYAVDDGEVLFAAYDKQWNNGYGNYVVIKHAENVYTIYSHMLSAEESEKGIVSAGDKVKAGQCIGLAGNSGNSTNLKDYGLGYCFCTELPQYFKDMLLCEIPDFTDKPCSYVIQELENAGFKVTTVSRTDDKIPLNNVIATDPPAHSMAEKGSTVIVIASLGQRLDSGSAGSESEFKGKPWAEVVQQIEKEGFKHTTKFQTDDAIPRDSVIGTIPATLSAADKDSKIIIYVSMGSELDKVSGEDSELDLSADLDGDGVPDALEAVNPGMTDEDWEQWKKFDAMEKQLEQQSSEAVNKIGTVYPNVTNEKWEVPDYTGKPDLYVAQQLEKAGVPYTMTYRIDDTVPKDCVIETYPAPHSIADKGSTIVIVASMGQRNPALDAEGASDKQKEHEPDLDGNGIPDVIEERYPDLNGNGIPDVMEKVYLDLDGDGSPDVME